MGYYVHLHFNQVFSSIYVETSSFLKTDPNSRYEEW